MGLCLCLLLLLIEVNVSIFANQDDGRTWSLVIVVDGGMMGEAVI